MIEALKLQEARTLDMIKDTMERSRALSAMPHDEEEVGCRREQLLSWADQIEYLERKLKWIRIEIADRTGTPEEAAEAMRQQKEHTDKISQLLAEFEDLARSKGLDLGEVIEQYNEENLPDGTEDGEYHYFRGIDMSNLP